MPVRSNITLEDDLSVDAYGRVTNDETVAFSVMPFCVTSFSATVQGTIDLNPKPFSAHAEPLGSGISLNLHEANQKDIDSTFQTSSNLSGREWSQYFNLKPLFWVILGHSLLLLLLIFLWRTQSEHLGLLFTESSSNARTTTKALKAYFIYAPPTQTAPADPPKDSSVEEPTVSSEPIISPPNTIEQIAKPPEVGAQVSNRAVSNTPTQGQTQQSTKEAVNPQKAEVQSNSAQAASTEQSAANEQSSGTAGSVGLFTQRYFERQREQALDDLVLEQANHYSKRSNLSEMSPEMEVLIVPNADDFSGPTSLDLELDPNRIVRKGDTCYRVVKVGTQINPYAENLGFPFDCSGKKMNQEIDDAIKAQLDKMMVKRPKG